MQGKIHKYIFVRIILAGFSIVEEEIFEALPKDLNSKVVSEVLMELIIGGYLDRKRNIISITKDKKKKREIFDDLGFNVGQ